MKPTIIYHPPFGDRDLDLDLRDAQLRREVGDPKWRRGGEQVEYRAVQRRGVRGVDHVHRGEVLARAEPDVRRAAAQLLSRATLSSVA